MAIPRDDLDRITVSGETDWEQYVARQKRELVEKWDEDLIVEVQCPDCGSEAGDGSCVQAQVLLESHPLGNNCLMPEGFNCFVCGLQIVPRERFLARHFIGQIPDDVANEYLKDIGHL
jgi:hypothetical protein